MFAEEILIWWFVPKGLMGVVTGIWTVQRGMKTNMRPPGQDMLVGESQDCRLLPGSMEWHACVMGKIHD